MSAKVTLQIQHPDGTSGAFELTEHDTFLLGRMNDCHLNLRDHAPLEPLVVLTNPLSSSFSSFQLSDLTANQQPGKTPE